MPELGQQLFSAENLGFPNLGHRLVEFTLNRASLTLYLSSVLFQLRISTPWTREREAARGNIKRGGGGRGEGAAKGGGEN